MSSPKLLPTLAIGAQYDTLLQRALSRFLGRATLEADAIPEARSGRRLAIEPTGDPAVLSVGWFGSRYRLRAPADQPFTAHEVRFAQAIGSVLAARYRAVFNPALLVERPGLFSGAIEDRYVGAFFDAPAYEVSREPATLDRVAEVLEILRLAALSTYENKPISTGVLLLEGHEDPIGGYPPSERDWPHYTGALASIRSFFRLANGIQTMFLVARDGRLLDIVDINRWAAEAAGDAPLVVAGAAAYAGHARATLGSRHIAVVLSPSQEIKVFAEGAQVFTFRQGDWHLLDLQAKYARWEAAVASPALARRLFQIALDLADARNGALFVVLRRPLDSLSALVAAPDRLDMEPVDVQLDPETPSRRHLLHMLAGRNLTELDIGVIESLATLDGATVTDRSGHLLAVGAILRYPPADQWMAGGIVEGARTTAALAASRFGPVLKVSADGMITFFDNGKVWDI